VLEKSRGVVVFAFNSHIDYVKLAVNCAKLVKKYLNLPVTLITEEGTFVPNTIFDNVCYIENKETNYKSALDLNNWRNSNRFNAYELSPYHETLLIDSDYLVLDNSLLTFLDTDCDYKLMHSNTTPTTNWDINMGLISIPLVWATVILFKKTSKAKALFDLAGRVQRNYGYYSMLYQFREGNFRNDYAFAIANNLLNGHTPNRMDSFPGSMLTLDKVESIELLNNKLVVREETIAYVLPKQNIHVMNKEYLQSKEFEQLVEQLCA